MNKMTNDNIVEEALSQLNMKYRSVTYKKSLIYFVTTENVQHEISVSMEQP